ncbi:MAG: class I SAM-dependent methyltransferase [Acidobacteriota bacterium]
MALPGTQFTGGATVVERQRCPACQRAAMSVFMEIPDVPVHCNLLWPEREGAVAAPRGHIRLGFCAACGLVYNLAFNSDLMEYTQRYENSLHFSPRFQQYARELAVRLVEKYHLRGKEIIEIGCGKGEFLALLCEGERNRGWGFDPGAEERAADSSLTFIRDFYSDAYADYTADLICCRHVLEHIQQPREFVLGIRQAMGDRPGTAVYFEVPDFLYTLRDLGIWDIIYEHCSYFSGPSLTRLFQQTGFTVREVYPAFGSQFLCLEASPRVGVDRRGTASIEDIEALSNLVSALGEAYRSKVEMWNAKLSRLFEDGRRIVVWGAGSKGVTFLNTVKAAAAIEHVVDINPRKQGMYVAGTGQRIVSVQFLGGYRPDTVVVMNAMYRDEIRHLLGKVGVLADVLTV